MSKTKTLYIIGNGFDLHHKLDTWYSTYGIFLKNNHPDIYDVFIEYYGFGDLDEDDEESLKDPLWCQFEASLAQMDGDLLLENHVEHVPNYSSDDFRDRDRYDIQIYIENIVDKATLKMRQTFEEFIDSVVYPNISDLDIIDIHKDSIFLTFNYTDTLERYYNVNRNKIEYIHNKSGEGDGLILGHGINPAEFEEQEEQPPTDPEEYERWVEWKSDQYDYSIERGKDEVRSYFQKSFKPSQDVISQNITFFDKINDYKTIYVLGHSLADVDRAYFDKVVASVSLKAVWVVTYFRSTEKKARKNRMKEFGIKKRQVVLVQMKDLAPSFWRRAKLKIRIWCTRVIAIISIW